MDEGAREGDRGRQTLAGRRWRGYRGSSEARPARERVGSGAPVPDERSSQSRGPHTAALPHAAPPVRSSENPRVKTVPVLHNENGPTGSQETQ